MLLGRGVGGNYVNCFVIAVISMGFGRAKSCGGDFKVIILKWEGAGRVKTTKRGPDFSGGVDASIHHKGVSHYVMLLF